MSCEKEYLFFQNNMGAVDRTKALAFRYVFLIASVCSMGAAGIQGQFFVRGEWDEAPSFLPKSQVIAA